MSSNEISDSSILSSNSSSNDDVANSNEEGNITCPQNDNYNQRYERRRRQANRLVDQVMDEMMMSNPIQFFQMINQVPRAPREIVERNREDGHNRLWNDYFADNPVFPPHLFRRRFRMRKGVFLRIVHVLCTHDEFFQQRPDATGRLGASALQKRTAAMRLLAYGTTADSVEDYIRISTSLARDSLQHFVEVVISHFSDEYLRRPSLIDLAILLYVAEQWGFSGMMGSIDCMHWRWKNCPLRFKGLYSGKPGRCNDINVLDRSPLFNDIFEGCAPPVNYVVNGHQYNMGYYLTDCIYPQWAAFIPTIGLPQNEKESLFTQRQESIGKDVERAFGVLEARLAIIRHPALARDVDMLGKIIIACIIIHNMTVEDERDSYALYYDPKEFEQDERLSTGTGTRSTEKMFRYYNNDNRASLQTYMSNRSCVRDNAIHEALKPNLLV